MNALAQMVSPMPNPREIWIATAHREPPEWVVEHMTTTVIHDDGSFEVEAADGVTMVRPGYAVFIIEDQFFACPTKDVPAKIALASGVAPIASPPRAVPSPAPSHRKAPAPKAAQPRRFNAPIGTPPAPQFAPLDQLEVDDTYQRSIEGGASQKLIEKIAINWDWRLCLPLLVSRRLGKLYVIDGQHRFEGAKLRGDIPHLPVVIFDFEDPKAEAELFVQANRSRRAMGVLDDFHAAIVAGDPKVMAVNEAILNAGLRVARVAAWQYWKPGEVVFVKAIQRALHSRGKAVVQQALDMIGRAFEGLVLTGVGPIFEALCTLIQEGERTGDLIDTGLMETVLRETGLPGWKAAVEGAESGGERADSMLLAVRAAYAEAAAEEAE